MTTPQQIAEAFSGHQFSDAYDHLAADIEWVLIGDATIQGRDQVIQACEQTAAELTETTTEFLRFLTIASTGAVAVDTVARYEGADGTTSVVPRATFTSSTRVLWLPSPRTRPSSTPPNTRRPCSRTRACTADRSTAVHTCSAVMV